MPHLIVFDLDLTLWHCVPLLWCDQLRPPLSKNINGEIKDANQVKVSLFHDVPQILESLIAQDDLLAIASRTSSPQIARQLLDLFDIAHYFTRQEIYPGDKTTHFAALHEQTGIPYSEMLFFDDEPRNISDVSQLGVSCHLVTSGMNLEKLEKALVLNG